MIPLLLQAKKRSRSLFEASQDRYDNNPKCIHLFVGVPEEEPTLECATDSLHFALGWVISGSMDSSDSVYPDSVLVGLDQDLSRRRIWNLMFKGKPVPTPEEGAVDKYFGILSHLFDEENAGEILDEILREVKGK